MAIWTCGCDFADCNLALISGATKEIPTLGVFASPLGQGIPWLHVHLQSACGRVAKPLPISPTNLGGDFCIWLVGHFGCENSKMAIFFSENQGPVLQSCPEHPGKAIPVEQTQPVTSSAIRLDSLMALRPMLRWTLLRCNDWCPADGSYQRGIVFFFLYVSWCIFSTDFGPGKQVEDTEPTPEEVAEKKQEERYCRLLRNKTASNVKSDSNMSFFSASWPLKIHSHWHASILHLFFPHSTENIGVLHLTSHLTPSDALMDWPAPAWLEKSQAGWITPLLLLVKVWSSQPWPQGIPGDTWGYPGRYDWMCPFSDKDEAGTTTASAIFLLFCILQFFVKFRPQRIRESS